MFFSEGAFTKARELSRVENQVIGSKLHMEQ